MEQYLTLNNLGLLLDIAGVIILFMYGLPSDVFPNGDIPKTMSGYDEKDKFKRYQRLARLGLFLLILGFLLQLAGNIQQSNQKEKITFLNPTKVEASCGQCQFGMEGEGCTLAVRINGKPYFVDGTSIDEHGDAHAHDGFCNAIKHAHVTGEVKNNRFVATSFEVEE